MNVTTEPQLSWPYIMETLRTKEVFRPLKPFIGLIPSEWPSIDDYNRIARAIHPSFKYHFIAQKPKTNTRSRASKKGKDHSLLSYIETIVVKNEIPTRPHNLHDLFNFFSYIMFPKCKEVLMSFHFRESEILNNAVPIELSGRGRSRLQDYLTLFDEGGSITLPGLKDQVIVFGHGIFEQHMKEPRPIRAMSWDFPYEIPCPEHPEEFAKIDELLSQVLKSPENLLNQEMFTGRWLPEAWAIEPK